MIPALISAGAAIAGGLIKARSERNANAANSANADRNIQMQREFAQNGIRWKVEDAKRAGIHPMYALGASGASFSPVSIGAQPVSGVADALASAGQDIGRAVHATRTAQERRQAELDAFISAQVSAQEDRDRAKREEARQDGLYFIQAQRGSLENEILALQLARLRQQGNPPMPAGGGSAGADYSLVGNGLSGGLRLTRDSVLPSGVVKVVPREVTSRQPGTPSQTAGSSPAFDAHQTAAGQVILPGQQLSEVLESMPGASFGLMAAEIGGRFFKGRDKPSDSLLPPGYRWEWSVMKQSWSAVRK